MGLLSSVGGLKALKTRLDYSTSTGLPSRSTRAPNGLSCRVAAWLRAPALGRELQADECLAGVTRADVGRGGGAAASRLPAACPSVLRACIAPDRPMSAGRAMLLTSHRARPLPAPLDSRLARRPRAASSALARWPCAAALKLAAPTTDAYAQHPLRRPPRAAPVRARCPRPPARVARCSPSLLAL